MLKRSVVSKSLFSEPLVLYLFFLLPICIDSVGLSNYAQNSGGKLIKLTSAAPFLFVLVMLFAFWVTDGLSNRKERYRFGISNPDWHSFIVYGFFIHIAATQVDFIYYDGLLASSLIFALTLASLALIFSVIRQNNTGAGPQRKFAICLLASFMFLCFVNFILAALGIEGGIISHDPLDASNTILMAVGIFFHRVYFAWNSGGLNGFAVLCLIMMFFGIAGLFGKGTGWVIRAMCLLSCAMASAGLILVDSRGALVALVVALIATPLMLRAPRMRKVWPAFLVLVQLSPLVIIFLAPYIATTPLFTLINRGYWTDPAAALTTGRSYIWGIAWHHITEAPLTFILGAGHMGHLITGMSREYAFIFPGEGPVNTHTTHNAMLQTLIDRGVVGVLFYASLIWVTARKLHERAASATENRWLFAGACGAFTAICIMGQAEAILTPYFPASIYFLAIAAALALPPGGAPLGMPKRDRDDEISLHP